ncbi:MAG: hypothetical protein ABI721_04150 [Candidatus Dojkabacteria bacterium]
MPEYYEKETPALIIQEGKRIKANPFLVPFSSIAIYSVVIPVVLLDVWLTIYQFIYFKINDIPMVKKSDYISFERWDLKRLNWLQKIDCFYCEYVNGIFAWAKGVGIQTEVYSCAIKHTHLKIPKEHEKDFYPESKFR